MFRRHSSQKSGTLESAVAGSEVSPPPMIRMVAIDLDGTLLNSEKRVSDQTIEALQLLPSAGVKIVIASARPPRSVRHIYQLLRLDTLQINYNGALIWDEPANQAVFHRPMPGELVRRIVDRARDMFDEVLVSCEIMDRWFTDRSDNTYTTETGRMFKPDVIAPLDEFCNQPVTKLMFLCEPRVISRLEPIVLEEFGPHVAVVRTDDELIQVMDRRVSKAVALGRVADHYQVPMKQVMAIGDAPNDVGMLQIAGVAVAMDNAAKVVKKVAHWIAPSNDDHGVHAALVRYGLCQ
jgi:Cof subfamily protein (haloacid dehalogenase superfamily)